MKTRLLLALLPLFVFTLLTKAYAQPPNHVDTIITIPVVVHIIYQHLSYDSIPDANVLNQLQILNEDFRKQNADTVDIPVPFVPYAGDAKIEFALAQHDPSGNATTGITRTSTTRSYFNDTDDGLDTLTHAALGGADSWDPCKYLNIWVMPVLHFGSGYGTIVGFSTRPSTSIEYPAIADGVYITYDYVGKLPPADEYVEAGRYADHLIGEYLDLYSIDCNDSIDDTPPSTGQCPGCPLFPCGANNICGSDSNGEMFMNHMSFGDSHCQNMFTYGQIARMRNTLHTTRSSLVTQTECVLGINELNMHNTSLYPNPAGNELRIKNGNGLRIRSVTLYNILGEELFSLSFKEGRGEAALDVSSLSSGLYFVRIMDEKGAWSGRFVKE